ncbi:MAG: sporulation integral membrane protein YtvI, partial [Clostridiales bacterium]|nr:sporulation integral membrane protein YtvI [Clostridiales bacterium]
FVDKLPGDIPSFVTEQANNILSDIKIPTSAITTVTKGITNFAFSLPSALIFIIVLLVSTYFISSDYDSTKKFIATQIPEKFREGISRTAQHLVNTLGKWLKAMGIIVLITFTELAIGLYLIGIDYAIIIAMIIAVIDVLPVLGVGTVLIPWSIIGFISGNVYIGVCILVLYIVITIVRNVLEPKIVGHQIGLHPLVTLISMYVGLRTIGFAGMFLFPIIAITLQKLQEWDYIKVYKTQSDTVSSEENESEDPPTEDSPTEDSPTE